MPEIPDNNDSSSSRHASGSACFRIAVSALIFHEGKVLLAHRRDIDWWNLPGGGMEEGETVDEALRREVYEETGLEVEVGQLVGVYSKPQKQEVVLTFRCDVHNGEPHETDETLECRYFVPDALPPNTLPKHRQRVEDALQNQQSVILRAQRTSTSEDQQLPDLESSS
jgi:ADP-ribose pyrophosphatase YjhB (NUDIX family)